MAGDLKLTGNVEKKARKMLKDVCGILDNCGIPYTLEGGTLLGIIRENRLLPWDNDIDITVTEEHLDSIIRNKWKFLIRGYRLKIRRTVFEKPHFPAGSVRLINVLTTKNFFSKGISLCDIFVKRKHNDDYFWLVGGSDTVLKSAPSRFYEELKRHKFNNYQYLIPLKYDEYLTHRYGDWKTPVKEYDYKKDDKAIVDSKTGTADTGTAEDSGYGKIRMIGKHDRLSRKTLKSVCSLLQKNGVDYFLDGGTLLGIIRENRLLPWDRNMNLSVSEQDCEKLIGLRLKLWLKGYRLKVRYTKVNMPYFPKGSVKMIKIKTRFLLFGGVDLLDIYVRRKSGSNYFWTTGTSKPVLKSVPSAFFDKNNTVEFDNHMYSVPSDHEDYLAFRYGDWKIPVKQFDSKLSDRSVVNI